MSTPPDDELDVLETPDPQPAARDLEDGADFVGDYARPGLAAVDEAAP
jgi:hypothetical protein